jgi:hypothetical protein
VSEVHTGRCACGAVTYETRGPLRPVSYCHCDTCRRQSGSFVAATSVPAEDLTIHGAENLGEWRATPDAARKFCRICGSLLFWQSDKRRSVSIMAGSLDKPTGLQPWGHIFVAEKGDYYDVADGLQQHEHWPPRG